MIAVANSCAPDIPSCFGGTASRVCFGVTDLFGEKGWRFGKWICGKRDYSDRPEAGTVWLSSLIDLSPDIACSEIRKVTNFRWSSIAALDGASVALRLLGFVVSWMVTVYV